MLVKRIVGSLRYAATRHSAAVLESPVVDGIGDDLQRETADCRFLETGDGGDAIYNGEAGDFVTMYEMAPVGSIDLEEPRNR